jgi:hypothetical protein
MALRPTPWDERQLLFSSHSFWKCYLSPLSIPAQERSGPVGPPKVMKTAHVQQLLPLEAPPSSCHPGRSAPQWRDLRFALPFLEMFFLRAEEKHSQERESRQRSLHYAALRSR